MKRLLDHFGHQREHVFMIVDGTEIYISFVLEEV